MTEGVRSFCPEEVPSRIRICIPVCILEQLQRGWRLTLHKEPYGEDKNQWVQVARGQVLSRYKKYFFKLTVINQLWEEPPQGCGRIPVTGGLYIHTNIAETHVCLGFLNTIMTQWYNTEIQTYWLANQWIANQWLMQTWSIFYWISKTNEWLSTASMFPNRAAAIIFPFNIIFKCSATAHLFTVQFSTLSFF